MRIQDEIDIFHSGNQQPRMEIEAPVNKSFCKREHVTVRFDNIFYSGTIVGKENNQHYLVEWKNTGPEEEDGYTWPVKVCKIEDIFTEF